MLLEQAKEQFLTYLRNIDRSEETVEGYGKDLKYFIRFLEAKNNRPCYLTDVTEGDIEAFLVKRKEDGIAAASRSRALNTLRSFYNWAVKKRHATRNPAQSVEGIKVKRGERVYLTETEVEALLNAIPQRIVYTVVKTLYYTGLRISECLNLTLNNVDLENKVIYVVNGKGGKDRQIPISDTLHRHLSDYLSIHRPKVRSNMFFATQRSGTVCSSYVNEMLAMATKQLGWDKHVTCHILRHSFASKLVKEDINIVDLQKLLGHSSLTVTSIYTHTSMENLQMAVNLI
jgi:site-specific recombinase XerD